MDFKPRGTAAIELAALTAARRELDAKLDALDAQQRSASEDVARFGADLADLERRALAGEQVSGKQRTAAENMLAAARAKSAEPWPERRAGIQRAIRDRDHAVQKHIAANFAELLAEVEEDGRAAADALTTAAAHLVDVAYERARCADRLDQLVASVQGRSRPGLVARSRAEALVDAARRLVERGGEQAPALPVDWRQARGAIPEAPETGLAPVQL